MMGRLTIALVGLGMLLGRIEQANAAVMTYTVEGSASGSLGENVFTDTMVAINFVADVTNVIDYDWGPLDYHTNWVGRASVTVAGVGTAAFLSDVGVFDNQEVAAAGIGGYDVGGALASIYVTISPAFTTYDLKSAIGPVTGGAFLSAGVPFPTDCGDFTLQFSGDTTFTASTVPEPTTLIIWSLLGGIGIGIAWWRRKRVTAYARQ